GVAGGAALAMLPKSVAGSLLGAGNGGDDGAAAVVRDSVLSIAFDRKLHTRLAAHGKTLTSWQPSESLLLADAEARDFAITGHKERPTDDAQHGKGHQSIITGRSADDLEKEVAVTFYDDLPGMAVVQVRYRNL